MAIAGYLLLEFHRLGSYTVAFAISLRYAGSRTASIQVRKIWKDRKKGLDVGDDTGASGAGTSPSVRVPALIIAKAWDHQDRLIKALGKFFRGFTRLLKTFGSFQDLMDCL